MVSLLTKFVRRSYSNQLSEFQVALLARGLPRKEPIIGVKDIIVVASGKEGVDKSTIASGLG
ncbi:iron-sulfur protein NUBPL-like [Drosophila biarmipes]|uniref:iron-sulfur protein NUBPL-like n=1 Tax=Drosophila biarmipes TaxID=125945 RepID=UPI0021CC525D|nr:iron-sulfur protein NUBPL-like [Drosophila biarmipes]